MIGDIDHIVVIQSLDNERKTGLEIYNDCITRNIEFRQAKMTHHFHDIHSEEQLSQILKFYEANAPYMIGGILIHIEMHGDRDLKGLVLANGELITWQDLVDLFRPINIKSCNNLYVSMATCNGRYLYVGVNPHQKSPYSCYISASTGVTPTTIVAQFTLLFETLIEKGNLVTAYLDMEAQGTQFYYKDSIETFEEAFQLAAKKILTDEALIKETLEQTRIIVENEGLQMPPESTFGWVREKAVKDAYLRYKKTFDFSNCQ